MTTNCLNCNDRKLLCHSSCKKYAEFKHLREFINKKHREFLDGWGYDGCLASKNQKK